MRRLLLAALATGALAAGPMAVPQAAATHGTARHEVAESPNILFGQYVPVGSARLLDTRPTGKVAAGGAVPVTVNGRAGIPAEGVSAVVVNLTVTGGTKPGYLSAYPGGTAFSGTSSLNFAAGETRANLATVPVGTDGSITVLNGGGNGTAAAHVLVDVQGYYLDGQTQGPDEAPSMYRGGLSFRMMDTRAEGGGIPPGGRRTDGFYIPEANVAAWVLNVTAVGAQAPGYLVAWDGVDARFPATSVLNFGKGRTTANNVVVPAGVVYDEKRNELYTQFSIGNGATAGKVNVVVDLVGEFLYTDAGEVFRPLPRPQRIVDSRVGKGLTRPGANQVRRFTAPVGARDPDLGTSNLVGNLTAVRPSAATYLQLFSGYSSTSRPEGSNLNAAAGQTVANHAFVSLDQETSSYLYNAAGTTDVLVDVTGYFVHEDNSHSPGRTQAAARAAEARVAARRAGLRHGMVRRHETSLR